MPRTLMLTPRPTPPSRRRRRPHPAWAVAAVTMLALVAGAAFRSSTGALLEPLEGEFGWSRAETSGAVTANLVIYGLTAPFAAAAMERFGVKRVVLGGLALCAAGSGLTALMGSVWQLWVLWGVFVGVGTGVMALVFGSIVANRWFLKHRGLVMGIFSGGNAFGQMIFLPVIVHTAEHSGWRAAALGIAGMCVLIIPLILLFFADSPAERNTLRYGEEPTADVREGSSAPGGAGQPGQGTAARPNAARLALEGLRLGAGRPAFWILVFTFWVCGWSTNGLIQTHFIPAAHDHGMPAGTAAGMLALIGIFDFLGTILSGWLTDRFNPAILLVVYYAGRGLSLVFLNTVLGPEVTPPLWLFIAFYGLDWVATVPPTAALCRTHFGVERAGVMFGWVFASHMVGAGVSAWLAGALRVSSGSYLPAWMIAAALCGAAAISMLWMRKAPRQKPSADAATRR